MSDDRIDVQLIGKAAAGDEAAFGELYRRHSGLMLGVLMKMLRRRDLAEEILQEAFLQAWEQADRYRPQRGSVKTWLLVIARSRALDRIRSRKSRGERERRVSDETPDAENPDGPTRLYREQLKEQMAGALDALPLEQRECIELAFFEGLTHRELAEHLDTPLGTVKSRILLGMNKLKSALAP